MCIIRKIAAYLLCLIMPTVSSVVLSARNVYEAEESARVKAQFIDQMLSRARQLKIEESFRRAHYKGDIGVCKNYVDYLFKSYAGRYRMREYPDVRLVIPGNNPAEDCAPYKYGVGWRDVAADSGNAFVMVGEFRYDTGLTVEENSAAARAMIERVQRGDFFQMAGDYGGGIGPHSLVFTADYDTETGALRWTDSNRTGRMINGERWGNIEYDKEFSIEWLVSAISIPEYGATLYRLRDDLVRVR